MEIKNGVLTSGVENALNEIENLIVPSVINGEKVTSIGENAFYCGFNIKNVTLPDSVTTIEDYAFCDLMGGVGGVSIPDSVTSIGEGAFYHCRYIKSIIIPDGVTEIKAKTFEYCESLESITIPDSVTSIDNSAFEECTSLKTLIYGGKTYNATSDTITQIVMLKSLRKQYNLSQRGLSDCTGIPTRTIEDWETGKRTAPDYMPGLIEAKLQISKNK